MCFPNGYVRLFRFYVPEGPTPIFVWLSIRTRGPAEYTIRPNTAPAFFKTNRCSKFAGVFYAERFRRGISTATNPIKRRVYTPTDGNVFLYSFTYKTYDSGRALVVISYRRRGGMPVFTDQKNKGERGVLFYYYYTSHGSRPERARSIDDVGGKIKRTGDITLHGGICMKNKFSFQEQKSFNNVHVVYARTRTRTHAYMYV